MHDSAVGKPMIASLVPTENGGGGLPMRRGLRVCLDPDVDRGCAVERS